MDECTFFLSLFFLSLQIVMEFCNAGSVTDVMRKIGRPLNEPECAAILKQVTKDTIGNSKEKS